MASYSFKDSNLNQAAQAIVLADVTILNQESAISILRQQVSDLQKQINVLNAERPVLSLKTPLQNNGFKGKLLAHHMPWIGDGKTHKVTRYKSNDPSYISNLVDASKICGIDGFVVTWQGLTSSFANEATILLCEECEKKNMLFALMLDPWAAKAPNTSGKEDSIIKALSATTTQKMLSSPAYIEEKAILDFSTGADFSIISKQFPNLQFWMRHREYSWPEITNTLANLKVDNNYSSMKMPAICAGFFDGGFVKSDKTRDWNKSVWDSNANTRVIMPEAGNFYLDTVALVPNYCKYACQVTLSDCDEGTDHLQIFLSMITGIRFGK